MNESSEENRSDCMKSMLDLTNMEPMLVKLKNRGTYFLYFSFLRDISLHHFKLLIVPWFPKMIIIVPAGPLLHYHYSFKQLIEKDLFPARRSFFSSSKAKCFIPGEHIFIFIMEVNGS